MRNLILSENTRRGSRLKAKIVSGQADQNVTDEKDCMCACPSTINKTHEAPMRIGIRREAWDVPCFIYVLLTHLPSAKELNACGTERDL
jgi:hypothetical protein